MRTSSGTRAKQIGRLLVEDGALRESQIPRILALQERDRRAGLDSRFGELCVRGGWVESGKVVKALGLQGDERAAMLDIGGVISALGYAAPERVRAALASRVHESEPLEEALIERSVCTPEQVRTAEQILLLLKVNAQRGRVVSTYVPFNVIELLVCERINETLAADGGCTCSQCWGNVFALAINRIPPRYVSDYTRVLEFVPRFRVDYGERVAACLADALKTVRENPKASCWSRFSDEVLAGDEAKALVREVVVHISNRHVHLSPGDLETLFGPRHRLVKMKDLVQPGQFAAQETVTIAGPKGSIERVRVLGPERSETQIEVSGTDQFVLGVQAPIRESGKLDGTPGIRVIGPRGEVATKRGVIRGFRHIHMLPEDAERYGLANGRLVSVRLRGDRSMIMEGVLVRVTETSALEMHIDTDEANAAGVPAESTAQVLIPAPTT
jgi:putative phosphotransacetylase